MEITPWWNELPENEDAAIDVIFDKIDQMLTDGKFTEVDDILREIDVEKMKMVYLIGFLTITYAAHSKLVERDIFFERVSGHLEKTEPERREAVLVGLRKWGIP